MVVCGKPKRGSLRVFAGVAVQPVLVCRWCEECVSVLKAKVEWCGSVSVVLEVTCVSKVRKVYRIRGGVVGS